MNSMKPEFQGAAIGTIILLLCGFGWMALVGGLGAILVSVYVRWVCGVL